MTRFTLIYPFVLLMSFGNERATAPPVISVGYLSSIPQGKRARSQLSNARRRHFGRTSSVHCD